jgi:hypothetical protein
MPRKQPVIYEINTWVWLADLSKEAGRAMTLANVPRSVWDELAALHIDYIWFMGVWQRSPASVKIARKHAGLQGELAKALPDLTEKDIVGSAYAIKDYVVAEHLGGDAGMADARAELRSRGISLLLDYVPNHVAMDHPWVTQKQDCLVNGQHAGGATPSGFFLAGDCSIAHGRDPYFPPWTDTAQLNAFSPSQRAEACELLGKLATMCDGVRCDMAMLLLNDVFQNTWGDTVGDAPEEEFWTVVIAAARAVEPGFKFMAEAYWDLELPLLDLGFDWAYDKALYDRLRHRDAAGITKHLEVTSEASNQLVKFTENHDEPRANLAFPELQLQAAAVTAALLPGPLLLHEGQLEGRRIRIPVQLGRRPGEDTVPSSIALHQRLLEVRTNPAFRTGEFQRLTTQGWPDNQSHLSLLAWLRESDGERFVIVVNVADHQSQARIALPWKDLLGSNWIVDDPVSLDQYERTGEELTGPGLFVDLDSWGYHIFKIRPA